MEPINRRNFMKSVAGTAALAALEGGAARAADTGPVILSTWSHGKPANERAAEIFKGGGSLLDAIEKGINVPESDPAVTSVGYGGLPNAEGVVELDASAERHLEILGALRQSAIDSFVGRAAENFLDRPPAFG